MISLFVTVPSFSGGGEVPLRWTASFLVLVLNAGHPSFTLGQGL